MRALDAFREVELYWSKKLAELQTELVQSEHRVSELKSEIEKTRARFEQACAETIEQASNLSEQTEANSSDSSLVDNEGNGRPKSSVSMAATGYSSAKNDLAVLLASDADRSKKSRAIAEAVVAASDRPLTLREIMASFLEYGLDLDADKEADYDLVRAAILGVFNTRRQGRPNYYWPKGKDFPD